MNKCRGHYKVRLENVFLADIDLFLAHKTFQLARQKENTIRINF